MSNLSTNIYLKDINEFKDGDLQNVMLEYIYYHNNKKNQWDLFLFKRNNFNNEKVLIWW